MNSPCGKVRVKVIEGKDLVNKDFAGKSDPYCTVKCGDVSDNLQLLQVKNYNSESLSNACKRGHSEPEMERGV